MVFIIVTIESGSSFNFGREFLVEVTLAWNLIEALLNSQSRELHLTV